MIPFSDAELVVKGIGGCDRMWTCIDYGRVPQAVHLSAMLAVQDAAVKGVCCAGMMT